MTYLIYALTQRLLPPLFFFLNDPPPPEFYPFPLHAALPIWAVYDRWRSRVCDTAGGHRPPLQSEFAPCVGFYFLLYSRPEVCMSKARPYVRLTQPLVRDNGRDRKSTRLNSSHSQISYAVFCL